MAYETLADYLVRKKKEKQAAMTVPGQPQQKSGMTVSEYLENRRKGVQKQPILALETPPIYPPPSTPADFGGLATAPPAPLAPFPIPTGPPSPTSPLPFAGPPTPGPQIRPQAIPAPPPETPGQTPFDVAAPTLPQKVELVGDILQNIPGPTQAAIPFMRAIGGAGEGAVAVPTGMAAWISGLATKLAMSGYELGKGIATGKQPDFAEAQRVGNKVSEWIVSNVAFSQPQTPEGQFFTELISSPFTASQYLAEKGIDLLPGDEQTKELQKILAETAIAILIPKLGKAVKTTELKMWRAKPAVTGAEVRTLVESQKDVPLEVKELVRQIDPKAEIKNPAFAGIEEVAKAEPRQAQIFGQPEPAKPAPVAQKPPILTPEAPAEVPAIIAKKAARPERPMPMPVPEEPVFRPGYKFNKHGIDYEVRGLGKEPSGKISYQVQNKRSGEVASLNAEELKDYLETPEPKAPERPTIPFKAGERVYDVSRKREYSYVGPDPSDPENVLIKNAKGVILSVYEPLIEPAGIERPSPAPVMPPAEGPQPKPLVEAAPAKITSQELLGDILEGKEGKFKAPTPERVEGVKSIEELRANYDTAWEENKRKLDAIKSDLEHVDTKELRRLVEERTMLKEVRGTLGKQAEAEKWYQEKAEEIKATTKPGDVEAGGLLYGVELPKFSDSLNLQKLDIDYDAKRILLDNAEKIRAARQKRGTAGPISWDTVEQNARAAGISAEEYSRLLDKAAAKAKVPRKLTPQDEAKIARLNEAYKQSPTPQNKKALNDYLAEATKPTELSREDIALAHGQITAARAMESLRLNQEVAKNPTPENKALAAIADSKLLVDQLLESESAASAGRMLNLRRKIRQAELFAGQGKYQQVLRLLQRWNVPQEKWAQILTLTQTDNPNLMLLAQKIREVRPLTKGQTALEIWYNFLLSNPLTHVRNAVSNTIVMAEKPLNTAIAAAVDIPASWIQRRPREITFKQAAHEVQGALHGVKEGAIRGLEAWKNGLTLDEASKLEKLKPTSFGKAGKFMPSRLLIASDEFDKGIIYTMDIYGQAYKKAFAEKGLTKAQRTEMAAKLISDPTPEMKARATIEAKYRTFQAELGRFGKSYQRLLQEHPTLRLLTPFVQVPINIPKYALERTPLEFGRIARKAWTGEWKGSKISEQIGKSALGTAVMVGLAGAAIDGLIVGAAPKDPDERAAFYRQGKSPYSVKVGDTYYSYQATEPWSTLVGTVADTVDLIRRSPDADVSKMTGYAWNALSQNWTNKPYITGLADLMKAYNDPEHFGERWVGRTGGSAIPNVVAGIARSADPYLRETKGIVESLKSRIPGLRETLPTQLDVWGEPIKQEGGFAEKFLSPFRRSPISEETVESELEELKYYPVMPAKTYFQQNKRIRFSPEEYRQYAEMSGKIAKTVIRELMDSDWYKNATAEDRIKAIREIFDEARKEAREALR